MKLPRVTDKFPTEIKQDTRRITGVTPALVKGYAETPWKYIPRGKGMRALSGGGKRGTGGL